MTFIPMGKFQIALAVAVSVFSLTTPVVSSADDTEVFFANPDVLDNGAANVLFIMDNSGTMGDLDGWHLRRIDRLKQAVSEMINNTRGVNIGLGTFSGRNWGGNILYPVTNPNKDVCVNRECDEIELDTRVSDYADDAFEAIDGKVRLFDYSLALGGSTTGPTNISEIYIPIDDDEDDVEEFPNGDLVDDSSDLDLYTTSGISPLLVGLRFKSVDVPSDATIVSATLNFYAGGNNAYDSQSTQIKIDTSSNSPEFDDDDDENVSGRPWSTDSVLWSDIPPTNISNQIITSPDISSLIVTRIRNTDWQQDDPLTFLMELPEDGVSTTSNKRSFKTKDVGKPAYLHIKYVKKEDLKLATTGMRFADLEIPQGAKINHAVIEFNGRFDGDESTSLDISGQKTGNAPMFTASAFDISSRSRTDAVVPWQVEPFEEVEFQPLYQTVDVGSIVQEIVNRSDWCGGNAMALFTSGIGSRKAYSHEGNPWSSPTLRVSYDPKSVNFSNTCLSVNTVTGIASGEDDILEDMDSGSAAVDAAELVAVDPDSNSLRTIALRFTELDVPANAEISSAYLEFKSTARISGAGQLTISGIATDDAAEIDGSEIYPISGLPMLASNVDWEMRSSYPNDTLKSRDISQVIQPIVDRNGWQRNNDIMLTLEPKNVSTKTSFASFENADYAAPRLVVNYQLTGTALNGSPVTLRTARQELLDELLSMQAIRTTPLTDAYYEAAAYMLGLNVEHGRKLGDQLHEDRMYKLSHPLSYEGSGSIYSPPDCDASETGTLACVKREIIGEAKYIAPEPGACQANQIVLLSDGAANRNVSDALIKNLIGVNSCAAKDPSEAECSVEMAEWLNTPSSEERPQVKTHTVGFHFSDDVLKEIAAAGGGKFYQAESASQLASVFGSIIEEASPLNTGFVAPAATVSQFNRLTNRDDVYFAMFKPESSKKWNGNLKRYQLAASGADGDIELVDANNTPIFDKTTGAIKSNAQSYWSDVVDGHEVERGGAAAELGLTRKLLTYMNTTGARPLESFHEDNTNIDRKLLGIVEMDEDYRTKLMKWARGVDVLDYDEDGDVTEVRASMGDPLHSAAHLINYPSTSPNGKSVVYMGTNEGFLHAIDTTNGQEVFGFIPPELLKNLDDFYANVPTTRRTYGLDGSVMGWVEDDNNNLIADAGEDAYIVVGMRRGGRNYYALNVSDPENPTLAWVIKGGTGEFAELGQTWSKPTKTKLKHNGSERDVLIFAAGYDADNDENIVTNSSDNVGRGFFIVDAKTGVKLASIDHNTFSDMHYSMPSDINVIDINFDGLADYFFVGDMGGQVWRFDFDSSNSSSVENGISGAVAATFATDDTNIRRRFYYPPDVALIEDDNKKVFLNIGVGSGWRAHPLNNSVEEQFYAFRDTNIFGAPRDSDGKIEYPGAIEQSDLVNVTTADFDSGSSEKRANGWYFKLDSPGEKVLSAATTIDRQLLFTTYVPEQTAADICSVSVGGGKFYAVDAASGSASNPKSDSESEDSEDESNARYVSLDAPGIPPSVSLLIPSADGNKVVALVGTETQNVEFGSAFNRTFWAEE